MTEQLPGGLAYPAVTTQYAAANAGPLSMTDTTSLFDLNGPHFQPYVPPVWIQYVLPGIPHNIKTFPNQRLLMANMSSGGSALILPEDGLADWQAIEFYSVGDFANVEWTGSLWTLIGSGGPSVVVASTEQVGL